MGKYTKIKADGGPIKGKPKPAIKVHDINDKGLLAYNDSVRVYNKYTKAANDWDPDGNIPVQDGNFNLIKNQKEKGRTYAPKDFSNAFQKYNSWKDVVEYMRKTDFNDTKLDPIGFTSIDGHGPRYPRFKKPTLRYEFDPHHEKVNINSIPINGSTNRNTIQGMNVPNPPTPTNPKPWDSLQLYSAWENLANQGRPVGHYDMDGVRNYIGLDEYNKMNTPQYADGGPIRTYNLNDPRLLAYNDSLSTYNNATAAYNNSLNNLNTARTYDEYIKRQNDILDNSGHINHNLAVKHPDVIRSRRWGSRGINFHDDTHFVKPKRRVEYTPYSKTEPLNINQVPLTGTKDTNPYNKYVVNRYLPTPESPTNPKPYDDIQLYSGHQNRDNRGQSVGYVMEDGKRRDIMADEYNAIMGSSVQGGTKLENTNYAMGGKLNKLGVKNSLWNNIRANKGSGKEPTKEMLEQEAKIKAEYMYGGEMPDMYGKGGYIVTRSSDRKGKTHKVTGPDGTVKYFGDSNLGQHPNDPARKKAFYARHEKNLKGNPHFRAFARKTWADGGPINTLEGDLISKVLMNRNQDKDFVQRAYAVGDYPNSNMFTSPDPDQFGSNMSHKMSWGTDDKGQAYMYPAVMNPKNEDMKVPIKYADYISSVGYKKATGMPYAMGGRMNQAQQLNAGKMRMGSDAPDGSVWKDIGAGAFGVLEGTLDTVTMGATDKLTDAAYKGLQKLGGSDASQMREQDMIHGFSSIGGAAIGAAVNPASGMTAISQGIKGLGQGVGNINENTQGIGNAISGLSSLTGLMPSGGGMEKLSAMGAQISFKQGGLMHINEGGTHEQNALGGVPIGPNALVEQGETINNDFVFSDRLKPKGSKKTYAQLSKSVDTKYRLRPDDKLSKEAKQMDLDRLAMQQETQKDEMSTKYMQKAMACGGKIKGFGGQIMGPISQSMNVTNGQNTMLGNGGLMSNFMEQPSVYQNPANLSNQYAMGGYADQEYDPNPLIMAEGGIFIKPENRGKFTASAQRAGMGVQEFAGHVLANKEDYSSTQVKRANFARNASKWKHGNGGYMMAAGGFPPDATSYLQYDEMGNPISAQQMYNPTNESYSTAPYVNEEDNIMDSYYNSPDSKGLAVEGPNMENGQFATGYPRLQGVQVNSSLPKVNAFNYPDPKAVVAYPYDKYAGSNQNQYPEVGNTGYLTNLAGNLVKAGMVATSKPPIYNPSLKFNRMNANPAERLAMQEGRREIQGTKDIIRNNATSSGQYLTNASLMGSSAANKLAGTIGGIRQGYDTQNVGIGNQEAQLNQQITAANNLAKETFRDNRLNQYNKILDSVIGSNQQRFATDVHANNYQNQILNLLKSGDYQISFDAKGNPTIIPTTK